MARDGRARGALARSGRLEEARLTFEKTLAYSNHLGMYAEEIAPTGEQIGNMIVLALVGIVGLAAAVFLPRTLMGAEP